MKTKIIFHLVFVIALATFATGCCTASLMSKFHEKTIDDFNPSAIYQSTNNDSFALEGTIHNYLRIAVEKNYWRHLNSGVHTYLIIPQKQLQFTNLTDETNTLAEIKKLSPDQTKHFKTKNTLPSNFQKVADLPKNEVWIDAGEHRPNGGLIIFIPFTVAADVALSPIYLIIAIPFMIGGVHT
jgi:hypothetical protein